MRRFLLFLAVLAMAGVPVVLYLGRTPTIQTKPLPVKNLTEYIFHSTLKDTHAAVVKAFDRAAWRGMSCDPVTLTDVPGKDTFLLTKYHDPVGKSARYWVSGEPADYLADFTVNLMEDTPGETSVVILVHNPEVIAGKKFGFGSCGPGFANRYIPVDPTTIEEYEILLRIGAELGERGMPALVLP